jgi:hypothetical protein
VSRQQQQRMIVDPATGRDAPYPSHAQQWREFHGTKAWLFNPWTGQRRTPEHIGSDTFGLLIVPPGEPTYSAMETPVAQCEHDWKHTPSQSECKKCGQIIR